MTRAEARLIHDPDGLNSGVPPVIDADHFITPVGEFFTRSHAAVPSVDPATWRLEVNGLVDRPTTFSLDQLRQAFPRREVTATLICAGMRRAEFLSLGPLPGELPWGPEAASTGRWAGVGLGDVLRSVGLSGRARYVEFIGLDQVERHHEHFGFGGSIDLAKALSTEVILATELNGAPLPAAHGFPLRAVVPGWIGARSVKWLGRIVLSEVPSENYFQTRAYRVQHDTNAHDPRDVSAGHALTTIAVNAIIAEPAANQVVPHGPVEIRGWAIGSAGAGVTAIEVSSDNGASWIPAAVSLQAGAWAWTFWEAKLELQPGPHTLVVRVADAGGMAQPAECRDTWNVKGYGNNAWHRVPIMAE
jgi:sulfite oxidase